MSDRELLELAARAAGIVIEWRQWPSTHKERAFFKNGCVNDQGDEGLSEWNPLTDDGDALRLAGALGLVVDCSRPSAGLPYVQHAIWLDEMMGTAELIRRAIVRAAAEIGREPGGRNG